MPKHTSFNVFLEFAAKVGFIGPQKQCFHQFQAKLLPNAQLVRKGVELFQLQERVWERVSPETQCERTSEYFI